MKNIDSKLKECFSEVARNFCGVGQAALLAGLLAVFAFTLKAQSPPGTPNFIGGHTERCGPGKLTFTINAPGATPGDEAVLIRSSKYPTDPLQLKWNYNFSNISCASEFRSSSIANSNSYTSSSTSSVWLPCSPGSFADPVTDNSSSTAKSGLRIQRDNNSSLAPNVVFRFKPDNLGGLEATPTTSPNQAHWGSKYTLRNFTGGKHFYAKVVIKPYKPETTINNHPIWRIAWGRYESTGANVFNERSSGVGAQQNIRESRNHIFAGVDLIYRNDSWQLQFLEPQGFLLPDTYLYNQSLTLEFIGNNTDEEIYYNREGQMHALAPGSYNIWAVNNGVAKKLFYRGNLLNYINTPNFPIVGDLINISDINAFTLLNVGNVAKAGDGKILLESVAFHPEIPYAVKEEGATTNGANAPQFIITTPTLTTTTTYWIAAIDKNENPFSEHRTWRMSDGALFQTLTVYPLIEPLTAPASVSRCNPGDISFTMSVRDPANAFAVWNAATGGDIVAPWQAQISFSNDVYTLKASNLSATTTYYVEAFRAKTAFTNSNIQAADPNQYNNELILGCGSSRVPIILQIHPGPGAPTNEFRDATRCGEGSVVFTSTAALPQNALGYRLYTQAQDGNVIAEDYSAPFELSTPSLNVNAQATFYIEAYNNSTGCASSSRLAVKAEVFARPDMPDIPDVEFCGVTWVTFTVTPATTGPAIAPESTRVWNRESGGDSILPNINVEPSSFFLSVGPLRASTTYFVEVVSRQGCPSARKPIIAKLRPLPQPLSASARVENVCAPATLTVEIRNIERDYEYRLYDSNENEVGNTQFPQDKIVVENVEYGESIFRLKATHRRAFGCVSLPTELRARFFQSPSQPTAQDVIRCGSGDAFISVSLGQLGGNEIRLYTAPSGGDPIASATALPSTTIGLNVTNTSTYWLQAWDTQSGCSSARSPVKVTIGRKPVAPTEVRIANSLTCGSYIPTLRVLMDSSNPGEQVRVYNTANLLIASCGPCSVGVENGVIYYYINLPAIVTDTDYFVSAFHSDGCESDQRRHISAKVDLIPGEPWASHQRRCANSALGLSQFTFTAQMGRPAGDQILLFENASDTIPIFTASAPYLMQINNLAPGSYTYYLQARNSRTGCVSPRQPLKIEAHPKPKTPINDGNNSYQILSRRCGPGQVSFTLVYRDNYNLVARLYSSPQPSDNRYIDQDASPGIGDVFVLSSDIISSSTTFYIGFTDSLTGCQSDRVPVEAIVEPGIPEPRVANARLCGQGKFTFSVEASGGGVFARLYDSENGGNLLAEDSNPSPDPNNPSGFIFSLETNSFYSQSREFWVAFENSDGCSSRRVRVQGFITPIPAAPIVSNSRIALCGYGIANIIAQMGNSAGQKIRLYTQNHPSASPIDSVTQPPYIFRVRPSGSTTYFLSSVQEGCESPFRTPVEVQILPGMEFSVSEVSRCGSGSATFTVLLLNDNSGDIIQAYLYSQPEGGALISSAQRQGSSFALATPFINTTTVFYVSLYNSTLNCESANRLAVKAQVIPLPAKPALREERITNCGPLNLRLTVNGMPSGASQLRLYSSDGSLISSVDSAPLVFTIGTVSTSRTYYVASAAGDCESERVSFSAVIYEVPSTPAVSDVSRCGAGSVTFTATMGNIAGIEIRLYTQDTGGVPLASAVTEPYLLTLSGILSTTKYFISAANEHCESPRRPVTASVIPLPARPSVQNIFRCPAGPVTFTVNAPGADSVRIYTIPIVTERIAVDRSEPFNFTATPSGDTTYYFTAVKGGCESGRASAFVNTQPPKPLASNFFRCGPGLATFTVTARAGTTPISEVRLFDANGTLLRDRDNASPFELSASVTTTTTFIIRAYGSEPGCVSQDLQVRVTVEPNPPAPVVASSDISQCGNRPARVEFTLPPGAQRVEIYDRDRGGNLVNPLQSGASWVQLPPGTYYLESFSPSSCTSLSRTPVNIRSIPTPGRPLARDVSFCGNAQVSFSAQMGAPAGNRMLLYASSTGDQPIASVNQVDNQGNYILTTPTLSQSATYYIAAADAFCESQRVAVVARRSPNLPPPVSPNQTLCQPGVAVLSVNVGAAQVDSVRLYSSGGSLISTEPFPFILRTPVSVTNTFYVASVAQGCVSSRVPVVIEVIPQLGPPTVSFDPVNCGATIAIIKVNHSDVGGDSFQLYDSNNNLVEDNTSGDFVVEVGKQYFVASVKEGCEGLRSRVLVEGLRIEVNISGATCSRAGEIGVTASGGSGGYSYTLSQLVPNRRDTVIVLQNSIGALAPVAPGRYFLTVRDRGNPNCRARRDVSIEGPSGPATVNVTNITGSSATVNWTAVSGAVGYRIRYRENVNSNWSELRVPASQLSAVIQTVAGQNYNVEVDAVCGSNINSSATSATFTSNSQINCGQPQGVCATPSNIRVFNIMPTSAAISWAPNQDGQGSAVCYVVRYGLAGSNLSNWPQLFVPHPNCFLEVNNLLSGQTYQVQIATNCRDCSLQGLTPYSILGSFTTLGNRLGQSASEEVSSLDLKVYPNPSAGLFTVSLNAAEGGEAELSITDVMGRTLHTQRVNAQRGENEVTIDLSGNAAGVYLLQLRQGEAKRAVRLILN
jgi:hypothetical protein